MIKSPAHEERLADLSRVTFSSRLWREIGKTGHSHPLDVALAEASELLGVDNGVRNKSVAAIYQWLKMYRRPDYVYRASIIRHYSTSHSARFISELHLRTSIADLVRIGVNLETFEIKSDRDKVDRLPNQLHNAFSVSPLVSLVAAPAVAHAFLSRTPSTPVGVYTMGPRGGLSQLHRPTPTWQRLESLEILQLLRAEERAYALRDLAPSLLSEPNTRQYKIAAEIAETISPKNFYRRATLALRRRPKTTLDPRLEHLYPILISVDPNQNQFARMMKWLEMEI